MMLKRLALSALLLSLAALPATAATNCGDAGDLASVFPQTALSALVAVPNGPAAPAEGDALARGEDVQYQACTATEDCNELADIGCSGSWDCFAVARNCPYQRGYVSCDGNVTQCSEPCEDPPGCTIFECRQPCMVPGCVGICVDAETCECETICQ